MRLLFHYSLNELEEELKHGNAIKINLAYDSGLDYLYENKIGIILEEYKENKDIHFNFTGITMSFNDYKWYHTLVDNEKIIIIFIPYKKINNFKNDLYIFFRTYGIKTKGIK